MQNSFLWIARLLSAMSLSSSAHAAYLYEFSSSSSGGPNVSLLNSQYYSQYVGGFTYKSDMLISRDSIGGAFLSPPTTSLTSCMLAAGPCGGFRFAPDRSGLPDGFPKVDEVHFGYADGRGGVIYRFTHNALSTIGTHDTILNDIQIGGLTAKLTVSEILGNQPPSTLPQVTSAPA